jgi:hypothetical protein
MPLSEEPLVSLRLRIDMNEFSDDHYILKLQFPSHLKLEDIEHYIKVKKPIPQIHSEWIERRIQLDRQIHDEG